MKYAIDANTNQIVDATGEVAKGDHSRGRFLHVLPKLWLPYEEINVKSDNLRLHFMGLKIPEIGFDIDDVNNKYHDKLGVARRPYPNFNYVVFGTEEKKMGFHIPLDGDTPKEITILTEYSFFYNELNIPCYAGSLEIIHQQKLTLEGVEDDSNCYSTESCMPVVIELSEYEGTFKDRYEKKVKVIGHPVHDGFKCLDTWVILTEETLDPLANNFILSEQFEDEILLRDKEQKITLSQLNTEHEKNAIVEMPPEIFIKAVNRSEIRKSNGILPQDHPALKIMCDWWNQNEEVPAELRRAKVCHIYVRINNDDEYHSIDLEVPCFAIKDYCKDERMCSARVGQHFLVLFLLGQEDCTEQNGCTYTYLVNGEDYENFGIDLADFTVGQWTLDNMRDIRYRYPEIFNHYNPWHNIEEEQVAESECY